jgi:uncharacterized protein YceK
MTKKYLLLLMVVILLFLASGCGTVGGAAVGAWEGAKKDWAGLQKMDKWMREHAW